MSLPNINLILPEITELPEQFISNIYKIAVEQNKLNDLIWLKKMVSNAKNKYEQQQKIKIEKQNNLQKPNLENQVKLKNEIKLIEEKKKLVERNDQFLLALKELPVLENYTRIFPKVSFSALVFIQKKYGFWTLRMLSVLQDKRKIYTNFAIKFTSLLQSDIYLQECIKLGLHKNSDLLYKTVVEHPRYNDKKIEIQKFIKWKEKEFVERKKEEYLQNNQEEISILTCIK
ncbi:hypothetical protein [Silvanigrella sp.]|jgi:hypothetical protein|uniref:hypothetical protein n=1 Tax=Silvanigrella sp. TaxID=2024976 RepID=UPI0037CAA741